VSLRRFQNCNTLIINHFRNYGVEDEFDCVLGMFSRMDLMPISQMRMVSGGLMVPRFVIRGGFLRHSHLRLV
jgi:hypothetical protein